VALLEKSLLKNKSSLNKISPEREIPLSGFLCKKRIDKIQKFYQNKSPYYKGFYFMLEYFLRIKAGLNDLLRRSSLRLRRQSHE